MWTSRWILALILGLPVLPPAAQDERPKKGKPVLIRDDRITEPVEPEVVTPDPIEARRNISVGDFYFKRGNLRAARERYREAVKYGPTIAEGFDKLVKTLEQMDDWQGALDVCREFLRNNPKADEVEAFQKKAEQLQARVGG